MNAKNILLGALVALMVLGGIGMAADSQVTATVNPGIEVSASSQSVTFDVGQNSVPVTNAVTVDTNTATWTLKAQGSNTGYFLSSGTGHYLGYTGQTQLHPLSLSVDTVGSAYYGSGGAVPMTANQVLATGVNPGSFPVTVNFDQKVGGAEPAVGDYQITLTYTGSL
jgi:hypothetical protein